MAHYNLVEPSQYEYIATKWEWYMVNYIYPSMYHKRQDGYQVVDPQPYAAFYV